MLFSTVRLNDVFVKNICFKIILLYLRFYAIHSVQGLRINQGRD